MGRKPCCSKEGLNRGSWTAMEDEILVSYINKHGEGKWGSLPKRAGLKRCGKSCRLRWLNYLRPGIKRGNISDDEEKLIVRLHRLLGNRWSLIAGRLPGRTDNEIKNYWNTTLGKKLQGNSNNSCSNYQAIAPTKCGPKLQASSDAGVARRRSPAPNTSPIRTKARRCTRVLAAAPTTTSQDRAPESVADHDDREGETAVEDVAAGQQDYLSFGSIDFDFESIELSFLLSPWRGDAAELTDGVLGATGDHQFGVGEAEAEVDLEELLGLDAGDDAGDQGVPSLGTWISCHGFDSS